MIFPSVVGCGMNLTCLFSGRLCFTPQTSPKQALSAAIHVKKPLTPDPNQGRSIGILGPATKTVEGNASFCLLNDGWLCQGAHFSDIVHPVCKPDRN